MTLGPQGTALVLDTKAVEAPGKGSVSATKAVDAHKGRHLTQTRRQWKHQAKAESNRSAA